VILETDAKAKANPYRTRAQVVLFAHGATRQGAVVFHDDSSLLAHAVDLPVWQDVHEFGILYLSVMAGVMKRKV